ncbi:MAG: galactose oxidase [Bacteroidales bacterium]|nr:galactose oxidase [Bacteroidales bacterium]MBN2762152.1 galactose oxidase [Bacteroidales bacterium]
MKKIPILNIPVKTNHGVSFIYTLCLILPLFVIAVSCDDDDDDDEDLVGNWIEMSDFEGIPRSDAIGFAIGNKGYVGSGYDGRDRLSDFWEYDADRDTWIQRADVPGAPRNGAVGFATDSKGYIGTGYDGRDKMKDFWEYDPSLNTWTQKADFGGSARYGAIGLTINNKCYIGTGYDDYYLKDFWQYDPASDLWTQMTSVGGSKRRDAVGFVINGKAYVCNGVDNGVYEDDFWEYDPLTDSWAKKNPISNVSDESFDDEYTSIKGINKVAFSLNGKGYVATGGEGSAGNIVWEYDPATDLWEKKTAFEGSGRADAIAFVAGNRAYVATGRSSSYYFDDIWAFDPLAEYDEDD